MEEASLVEEWRRVGRPVVRVEHAKIDRFPCLSSQVVGGAVAEQVMGDHRISGLHFELDGVSRIEGLDLPQERLGALLREEPGRVELPEELRAKRRWEPGQTTKFPRSGRATCVR